MLPILNVPTDFNLFKLSFFYLQYCQTGLLTSKFTARNKIRMVAASSSVPTIAPVLMTPVSMAPVSMAPVSDRPTVSPVEVPTVAPTDNPSVSTGQPTNPVVSAAADFTFDVMRPSVANDPYITNVEDGAILGKNTYRRNFNIRAVPGSSLTGITIGSVVLIRTNVGTGQIISTLSENVAVCLLVFFVISTFVIVIVIVI